jgi:hypothetical protein
MKQYVLDEGELEDLIRFKLKLRALIERRFINYCDIDEAIKESSYWNAESGWMTNNYLEQYKQLGE